MNAVIVSVLLLESRVLEIHLKYESLVMLTLWQKVPTGPWLTSP
jgi:hypothetical protein